uniref:FAD-dependent oxidoreductase domain-containing protein 1 n=1 Tax=Schistocephalus solidus TaxID=70667 RepID=A0A0X3Q170_SCHSO
MYRLLPQFFTRVLSRKSFLTMITSKFSSRPPSSSPPSRLQSDFAFANPDFQCREDKVPKQTDVLVIGGGVIGWAVAYWIRFLSRTTVTVVERDPTMSRSSSVLSLATLRTQFSEVENIQMSLFGAEFLREVEEYLRSTPEEMASVNFVPHGHLILADEKGVEVLNENAQIQSALEVPSTLMSPAEVAKRWPWMDITDVRLASFGERYEGWFDPWLLIRHLRNKAHVFGANFVVGDVKSFTHHKAIPTTHFHDRPKRPSMSTPYLNEAVIALPNGSQTKMAFHTCVNAAGPWAADIVTLALRDFDEPMLRLPVEKRKQNIFVVRPDYSAASSTQLPGIDSPILLDHSGLFMQRQGLSGDFAVCMNPCRTQKGHPDKEDFEVDYSEFTEQIQPRLANRIPAMATAKIRSAWAYLNDYNSLDQSLIIGPHPFINNLILANGASGLSTQQSIAIGRAVAEYVHYRHFKSIDLTRFSFDRFYLDLPISERNTF